MRRNRPLPTLLAGALVAGLILYLGIPRLAASLIALPENDTLDQIRKRRPVDLAALRRLAESRQAAAEWTADGQLLTDRALALLLARTASADNAASRDLKIALLEAGLARKPLAPHAWARLALARLRRDGPGPASLAAVRQSIYTGPNVGELALLRVRILMAHPRLDRETGAMLGQQIRLGWLAAPDRLIVLARESGAPLVFNRALARNPEALVRFEAGLRAPPR